jgi:hypothetical protein
LDLKNRRTINHYKLEDNDIYGNSTMQGILGTSVMKEAAKIFSEKLARCNGRDLCRHG